MDGSASQDSEVPKAKGESSQAAEHCGGGKH
jgi:hypothetical protein